MPAAPLLLPPPCLHWVTEVSTTEAGRTIVLACDRYRFVSTKHGVVFGVACSCRCGRWGVRPIRSLEEMERLRARIREDVPQSWREDLDTYARVAWDLHWELAVDAAFAGGYQARASRLLEAGELSA